MAEDRKLLLFVSVDIVGSTAYKNRVFEKRNDEHPWLQFFRGFPEDMTRHVREQLEPSNFELRIWKTLGDEVIYVCQLQKLKDACTIVEAFAKALMNYDESLRSQKKIGLGVKGAAWLAGFPVINAEIEIAPYTIQKNSAETAREPIIDYLGPSIDAGFRIAKYATRKKFVVSIELALVLADKNHHNLYFDGLNYDLKGVFGGRPYPIFWVQVMQDDPHDVLLNVQYKPANHQIAKKYIEEFIDAVGNPLILSRPYIVGDGVPDGADIPSEHEAIYKRIQEKRLDRTIDTLKQGAVPDPGKEAYAPQKKRESGPA